MATVRRAQAHDGPVGGHPLPACLADDADDIATLRAEGIQPGNQAVDDGLISRQVALNCLPARC